MTQKQEINSNDKFEASFSVLSMSIASSAAVALGLTPNPQDGNITADKNMARFNIDLLIVLQEKTKGNLTVDESSFIDAVINDLQIKYLTLK